MNALRQLIDDHALLGRAVTVTLEEPVAYDSAAITRIVPATVEAVESEELSDCGILLAVAPPFTFGGRSHGRVWVCALEGAPPLYAALAATTVQAVLLDEQRENSLMHATLHLR